MQQPVRSAEFGVEYSPYSGPKAYFRVWLSAPPLPGMVLRTIWQKIELIDPLQVLESVRENLEGDYPRLREIRQTLED